MQRDLVSAETVRRVAQYTLTRMRHSNGHAVFRRQRWGTTRVCYTRWCDSPVALGFASVAALLEGRSTCHEVHLQRDVLLERVVPLPWRPVMCGICGCIGRADEETVVAMTRLMVHRGPDGEGVHCFPSCDGSVPAALGHRRLSIIDPTPRGGGSVMPYARWRYWITYNGELYNFKQLRKDLERDGLGFATETDTQPGGRA